MAARAAARRTSASGEERTLEAGLTAEKMRECRWVRPELVGQFEFLEWTARLPTPTRLSVSFRHSHGGIELAFFPQPEASRLRALLHTRDGLF